MSAPLNAINNLSVNVLYKCAFTKIERNDTDITIRISHISKNEFQDNVSWNATDYENFIATVAAEIEILDDRLKSSAELQENATLMQVIEQERTFLSHVTDVYNSRFG